MKNGKEPTIKQCKFIQSSLVANNSTNPKDWLVVKDTPRIMVLISRLTKRERTIKKGIS